MSSSVACQVFNGLHKMKMVHSRQPTRTQLRHRLALVGIILASLSLVSGSDSLALSPGDHNKQMTRARGLAMAGRYDDACTVLRGILDVDAKNVDAHYFLGYVQGRQGKFEASISNERAALDVDPNNAAAYSVLGLSLGSLHQYTDAGLALQHSIKIEPSAPSNYVNLAAIREKQGSLKEACDLYQRALAINPEYARAYLGLGEALGKLGHTKEQIEACRQAVKYAPKSAMTHAKLGMALSASGDIPGSIKEGFTANALKVQESWNDFLGMFLAAWGLIFLTVSLLFAIAFAGSRFKPQDGEKILRSFFLIMYKDHLGRLVVTDSRLVFVPELFSKAFGATRVSIQRAQVESMQYRSTTGSGTVSILTRDQSVHQFKMQTMILDPLRSFLVSQALEGTVPAGEKPIEPAPGAEPIAGAGSEASSDAEKPEPEAAATEAVKIIPAELEITEVDSETSAAEKVEAEDNKT